MKKQLLFLFALLSFFAFSQKIKQKALGFEHWNFPKYYIEDEKIGIISDENLPERFKINFHFLQQLNFRSLEIVKPSQANNILYIKPLRVEYLPIIKHSFNNDTSGKVVMSVDIQCVIKNGSQVVFDFIFNGQRSLLERRLPVSEAAFPQEIMKEFSAHQHNSTRKHDDSYQDILSSFVIQLKQDLDFQPQKMPYILYYFEDKALENITQSVQKTIDLFEKEALNAEILTEKIHFWEEISKNYNISNKKEKKIYWVLMQNISASYFFLGNYEKSLEYQQKMQLADYKKQAYPKNFIEEITENRKPYQNLTTIKPYQTLDFSKNQDFSLIEIVHSNRLTEDFAQEEQPNYFHREKQAEAMAKILYIESAFEFLNRLSLESESFEKESIKALKHISENMEVYEKESLTDNEKIAHEWFYNTHHLYLDLAQEIGQKLDELKVMDVSTFSDEQKIKISEISADFQQLFHYFEVKTKSLIRYKKNETPKNEIEEIQKINAGIHLIIRRLLKDYHAKSKQAITLKINSLYQIFFKHKSENIKKLPYLNYLAYTLTQSEPLNMVENEALYKKYLKEYKTIYYNIFYSPDFKIIHEKDTDFLFNPKSSYYKLAVYQPEKEEKPHFTYDENNLKKMLLLFIR